MSQPKLLSSSTVGRSKFKSVNSTAAPSQATSISAAPPTKAPVVRKTRSKTGCLTCRKRRVKCDETRPVCKNCTKAGRKCDFNMRLSFRSGLSSKLMQQIGNGEQVMDFSARAGTPEITQAQPPLYVSFPVKEKTTDYPTPPLSAQAFSTQTPLKMATPTLISQFGTETPVPTQDLTAPLFSTQTTSTQDPTVPLLSSTQTTNTQSLTDQLLINQTTSAQNQTVPLLSTQTTSAQSLTAPLLSTQTTNTQDPTIPLLLSTQTTTMSSLNSPLLGTHTTSSQNPPNLHVPIAPTPLAQNAPILNTSISAPVKLEEYEWKFDYGDAKELFAPQISEWMPDTFDELPMDYTGRSPAQSEVTEVKREVANYEILQKKIRYKKSLQHAYRQKHLYREEIRRKSYLPPKQSNISYYIPSATESPLANPTAVFLLQEYIKYGQGISCFDRFNVSPVSIFDNVNHQDFCGMSNFWTFDVPLAALSCDFLLHAIFAWSALNVSVETPDPEGRFKMLAVEHYNMALRLLSSELRMGIFKYKPIPTVATCIMLSFYETYSGDLGNWYGHTIGAYEIIRESSLSDISLLDEESVAGIQRLELLYSFLRVDIMHAIIGGTGPFAPWQFWAAIPSRVTSNPAVYGNDEVLKFFARLCEYVEKENLRKQHNLAYQLKNQEQSEAFIESMEKWNNLKKLLAELQERLSSLLAPLPLTSPPQTTPFGPKTNRASAHHDFIACFLHTAELLLNRIHPKVAFVGFAAIPSTAKACAKSIIEINRCVPPSPTEFMESDVYTTDGTGVAISQGEKLQLLCSFTVPMFLGGIQLTKPEQQDFVANWFEDIYDSTGFKPALVTKYSLLRVWADVKKQRTRRSPSTSPISPSFSPEATMGSSPSSSTSCGEPLLRHEHGNIMAYDGKLVDAMSDSANRVRFARGILGDVTEKMYQLVLSDDEDDDGSEQT